MNKKIDLALDKLNSILPLSKMQKSLEPSMQKLHRDILRTYVTQGRSLNRKEISARVNNIDHTIETFSSKDLVVFNQGEPVGTYPFTMEDREHVVHINGHSLHCMCALDVLSVSPMFDQPAVIDSQCRISNASIHIEQNDNIVSNMKDNADVYVGISWAAATSDSCCANTLCTEMIFLKGEEIASDWLNTDSSNRELFTLEEAIEFGSRFFKPLLANALN